MNDLAVRGVGLLRWYATAAGPVRAVDGVDLEIREGQQVAIVGPSGCGKSTLLAIIGCLEPVDGGSIEVLGTDLGGLGDEQRARWRRDHVGFIFQAYDLLPFLTATENVALQCGISERDGATSPRELLGRLGLGGHEDKLPDQLSGGQKQRVGIARCLVHRPALVLADEPTGGLDSVTSRAVVDLLLEASAEIGATTIVVTHDPAVAERFERTIALRDGRVVVDSAPAGASLAAPHV
ncbi:MAG TPA: ABC transporter ATP-binding protein [Candidatus Dormibacteraeota bacterium]|jgi:putative ABC transport system ATP-binding protein